MSENFLVGEIEHLVLVAVLRLEKNAYAVQIGKEIRSRGGIDLSRGTLYITLSRLERKGFLQSWFADPTPERGGKSKRYFKLRAPALRALKQTRRVYQDMWRGVKALEGKA